MRTKKHYSNISNESLLHFPLLRMALNDPDFSIQARGISMEWFYQEIIPLSMSGFNPQSGQAYIGAISRTADWLKNPQKSARLYNLRNQFAPEIQFLLHDYLHIWSYRLIQELKPELGFGTKPISSKNFEDLVFCHLLTETVAVVGLDYWSLSLGDLQRCCPIGSIKATLTVSFLESQIDEYRKFNPNFNVQTPKFFEQQLSFYCSGEFVGFDSDSLRLSAIIFKWLDHEIEYGELQRQFTRRWLAFLSNEQIVIQKKDLEKPVAFNKKWQKDLAKEISSILWDLIKNGKPYKFKNHSRPNRIWSRKSTLIPDLNFTNLNAFEDQKVFEKILEAPDLESNFKMFFYQFVSSHDLKNFDREKIKLFPTLLEKKDFKLLKSVFKGEKRLEPSPGELKDLFLLN